MQSAFTLATQLPITDSISTKRLNAQFRASAEPDNHEETDLPAFTA